MISCNFYLDLKTDKELHKLYARIRFQGNQKKIFSIYQIPESCWNKKESKAILRSNNPTFKGSPRAYSKANHANIWIESIRLKIEELNQKLSEQGFLEWKNIIDCFLLSSE